MGTIDVKPDPWQRLVAIGSILSVLFVAVGLYVTNEANRGQQRLTEQGQITDRFTKAVEQLGQTGPEKVTVRLGAIYALERIMRDSAVDHPAVVDVLAAFVRVNAPQQPNPTQLPSRPPADIQAALTVLGRRNITHDDRGSPGRPSSRLIPDLTNTNLALADLRDANLTGSDLTDASLTGADLVRANLRLAFLARANLYGADLTGADLSIALLTGADLTNADLPGADLSNAFLEGANLNGADLTRADLTGANLTRADLSCARTDDRTRLPEGVARPAPCD
ncbi:pentapeptide repeat-containing protein [Micromonospora carbonacea]|uniref:pentapeptide repeat-containing protein n=1 Tax=Micromonospora carbonacea TaxID=47853 RepID=UPI00094435B5|nr:pentapeptide repeat-containing protein [Micromonospora carbonacea]